MDPNKFKVYVNKWSEPNWYKYNLTYCSRVHFVYTVPLITIFVFGIFKATAFNEIQYFFVKMLTEYDDT